MYSKSDLLAAINRETAILQHLVTKIPHDMLDYRPSESQRSVLELLQYLSFAIAGGVETILAGSSDGVFEKYVPESMNLTLENASEKFTAQLATVESLLADVTAEDLATELSLWGGPVRSKGAHLVELPLAWLYAYKTQLFVTIKMGGISDIGTMNLWAGMDAPAK